MKTNDNGIKTWLEQKGVDWLFIREARADRSDRFTELVYTKKHESRHRQGRVF